MYRMVVGDTDAINNGMTLSKGNAERKSTQNQNLKNWIAIFLSSSISTPCLSKYIVRKLGNSNFKIFVHAYRRTPVHVHGPQTDVSLTLADSDLRCGGGPHRSRTYRTGDRTTPVEVVHHDHSIVPVSSSNNRSVLRPEELTGTMLLMRAGSLSQRVYSTHIPADLFEFPPTAT